MILQEELSPKLNFLAMHGRGSNSEITKLQLSNLNLLGAEFDFSYLNGPIIVDEPGNGLEGLKSGTWYSWLSGGGENSPQENEILFNTLCYAVYYVLKNVAQKGPFDGVFGFSQGALIAALANNLYQDEPLQAALISRFGDSVRSIIPQQPLFGMAVFACAASSVPLAELRRKTGLSPEPLAPDCQSIHLIGREDPYKPWSESFVHTFEPSKTTVFYLAGGHEINYPMQDQREMSDLIRQRFNAAPPDDIQKAQWLKSSEFSARAIAKEVQFAEVKLKLAGLPETIHHLLAAQSKETPLFRQAREQNLDIFTSYGEMLQFCSPGGDGDLRQLGVKSGDVVAYVAPAGGNATAACAFLSIAAQACAVPFSPTLSESDALLAFEQFNVKHLVMFTNVTAPGIKAAFEAYSQRGSSDVYLHYAKRSDKHSPGLFHYLDTVADFTSLPPLSNKPTAHCLLLRTSGTTSLPKVVPLKQRDLVLNGAILADSMGIHADDVTYSVMPLDHIGGLSASILCSVAVGATVTCENVYQPEAMVEALSLSNPRPTWYSSVPTIHNGTLRHLLDNAATYLDSTGRWQGHSLRMIRSGAADLKESDRQLLESTYGCPVVTTYSMSEQMPISQPARNEGAWLQQPGAVGVPITASLAIVEPNSLRPLPFGNEGEIAIAGETVFPGYQDNPAANNSSHFLLKSPQDGLLQKWFLTGDLGELDRHGTLTLKGRIKELIKKGGEQVAPAEVEALLTQHAAINLAVCFSVPSKLYGEEVGCALVLDPAYSAQTDYQEIVRDLRMYLRDQGLASFKIPTCWKLVVDEDIPRTASRKVMRNKVADHLSVTPGISATAAFVEKNTPVQSGKTTNEVDHKPTGLMSGLLAPKTAQAVNLPASKASVDWQTLAGFRFLLACYVMFMHIGSNDSWGAFSNLRQFPWHVHTFFTLAGFSLAVLMPSLIKNKMAFVSARVIGMYPLYGLAVLLALGNLLVTCQPATFSPDFHWAQIVENGQMFCEGTPWVQDSWLANVLLTLGIHLTGLQATPLWGASWFMGFYLWFISMYFQCLVVFPYLYNALYKNRGNIRRLFTLTLLGLGLNTLIILAFWYGYAVHATGYGFFDALTGLKATPSQSQMAMGGEENAVILGFYLFAPFWMVYFIAGMCAAFLYDAIRPAEHGRAYIWGWIADAITLAMIVVSVAHIAQGYFPNGETWVSVEQNALRPAAADSQADPAVVNRIWDNIYGRLFAPITLLWIFALSTGQGVTARIFRSTPISQTLAPTAFACFLFHQMIGQWYYSLTRHGEWWNWWSHQKAFYWFSPQPVPVEWYEYFYVVGLVVLFAKVIQPVDPLLRRAFGYLTDSMKDRKAVNSGGTALKPERDPTARILTIIYRITGMEVKPEWNLEECGLASLGIVQFTNALQAEFSSPSQKVSLSVADIMSAKDINEIASMVVQDQLEGGKSPEQVLTKGLPS
ncbi:AMP-binding protein [Serratia fonticola]|uniref:AMP-binding protein n=1 Tax=Serratia fonticola TaxID=47917 RepID=UPI0021798DA9|nr:AMP-binding protein [Serratia fonticola]CAI1858233.1 2-succinylbenzoate--CoA ligase [Serratia fonticola]CAI1883005.1 2-succinylbenzoate--CoA ligase [Serratia fonticola]CAI1935261.1 2-succinylbenzoate--CoA ligase [Serratia fonticola]